MKLKLKVSDIIGGIIANMESPAEEWPDVVNYTYRSLQSTDSDDVEVGLFLLGMLSLGMESTFCSANVAPTLISIFQKYLSYGSTAPSISIAALQAFISLVSNIPMEESWDIFQPVLPAVFTGFNSIGSAMKANNGEARSITSICTYVELLVEFGTNCPNFFVSQLVLVFEEVMAFLEREITSREVDAVCHLAIEFLVTLAENIPKRVRKMLPPSAAPHKQSKVEKGYFISRLFPLLSTMMTSISPDSEYFAAPSSHADNAPEHPEALHFDVGETALYRIWGVLGLAHTWPTVSAQISVLLSSHSWVHLYAGLRQLGNYLEVSKAIVEKSQLKAHREDVVHTFLRHIHHPTSHVREAACYLVTQLFVSHGESLSAELLDVLLPPLLRTMDGAGNGSVAARSSALSAVSAAVDHCALEAVEPRVDEILTCVCQSLTRSCSGGGSGGRGLRPSFRPELDEQEAALGVLLSLSETVKGDQLGRHYSTLMPLLTALLQHYERSGEEELWLSALTCTAMVGEASGKERFKDDALGLMRLVSGAMGRPGGAEERHRSAFLKVWVRIA